MSAVMQLNPTSVLDVGVGFGKYGFLCREYLELWDGRDSYHDWRRRIDGIEACRRYINPASRYVYDNIYEGEALALFGTAINHKYDLILLIDVLEHFAVQKGQLLLQEVQKKAKHMIVSTPKDIGKQGAAFGNKYEVHRAQWSEDDFAVYENKQLIPDHKSLIYVVRF